VSEEAGKGGDVLTRLADVFVGITAALHVVISAVEMFLWPRPWVYQRLDLGLDDMQARTIAPIVQNAGLYNGFLAAGLIWGLFPGRNAFAVRVFFLSCVIIAGVFGAVTLKPMILALQSLPGAISLALTWLARPKGLTSAGRGGTR
jgi:putative membrane protein